MVCSSMSEDHTPRTGTPVCASDLPPVPVQRTPWTAPAAPAAAQVVPPGSGASLVFGILAIVLWGVPLVGLALGILAIVLGARSRSAVRSDPTRYQPSGAATAGLVCGIIGTALSTLTTAFFALILFMISVVMGLIGMVGSGGPVPPHGPLL